jgi:hypothetical protein
MLTFFFITVLLACFAAVLLMMQDVPYSNGLVLGEGGYDMKGLVAPVATGTLLQVLSGEYNI